MSLTIVQKSNLSIQQPESKKALVLAGGAISGGAFKVGGLLALNRFLRNFSVNDFDMYVGISAGAFLAAPLSTGVAPWELVQAIRGNEGRISKFSYMDFYYPNWREFITRPAKLARNSAMVGPAIAIALGQLVPRRHRQLRELAQEFLKNPGLESASALTEPLFNEMARSPLFKPGGYLPSGVFDNSPIEAYVRRNLEKNGFPNDFRKLKLQTGKSLYIVATNVNTAQRVVFGHDENQSASISEAVQASTAIPGFFKPARVGPEGMQQDFMDAAVRKTANISSAVRHGAQLIICYNPFRPFMNYHYRPGSSGELSLADMGMGVVLNQAFRTMLHSRLRIGIEKLRLNDKFKGDCILIEPAETDSRFFAMNPLAFWKRPEAAAHGYRSVKTSVVKNFETLKPILAAHGITCDLEGMEDEFAAIRKAKSASAKLDVMQADKGKHAGGLRLVSGGR